MTRDEFRAELAEFLMVEISEIRDDATLQQLGWDSLALLSVISLVEETWGIELTQEQLDECQTIQELLNLFDSKWVNF